MSQQEERQEMSRPVLIRTDVVILASSHNPSILSPEWLRDRCGVTEEATNFVHTPLFSRFDTAQFVILAEPSRVQIVTVGENAEARERIVDIAVQYVAALPHVPYVAVGANCLWMWPQDGPPPPGVNLAVGGRPILRQAGPYHTELGGIIYGTAPEHRMRLAMEAQPDGAHTYSFNFHVDLNGPGAMDPGEALHFLMGRGAESGELLARILGLKQGETDS